MSKLRERGGGGEVAGNGIGGATSLLRGGSIGGLNREARSQLSPIGSLVARQRSFDQN